MSRTWATLLICALAAGSASGADVSGRVIDAVTGEPIGRAHITIRGNLSGDQITGLAIVSDATGGFSISNLPAGNWQLSCEKPGYLATWASLSGDTKPTPILLRLTRQAVIDGSVVDEKGLGVPLAFVQLFRRGIVDGRRQIQPANSVQTDETGEFRIFGVTAGLYYVGANATVRRLRDSRKLAYAPTFYAGATDLTSAQSINVQSGTEEHVKVTLRSVPAHQVRGKVLSAERYANVSLRPQDPDRFPMSPSAAQSWDEKTHTFVISGVPPGDYILESISQTGSQQRHAVKAIAIDDADLDGIVLEPGSLSELICRVTKEGSGGAHGEISYISLRSRSSNFNARILQDGEFVFSGLIPGSYNMAVFPVGSYYVRSIQQGGRDVRRGGIVIGDAPPEPIDIDLSSHGASIEGAIATTGSDTTAVTVGLFRNLGGELVFEKQTSAAGFAASVNGVVSSARFVLQGIAPGEYVLLAWTQDMQMEFAEPEFMRQYGARGKTVQVIEDGKLSVVLDGILSKLDQ